MHMKDSMANIENCANFGNQLTDYLDVSPSQDKEETTPAVPSSKSSTEPSRLEVLQQPPHLLTIKSGC